MNRPITSRANAREWREYAMYLESELSLWRRAVEQLIKRCDAIKAIKLIDDETKH